MVASYPTTKPAYCHWTDPTPSPTHRSLTDASARDESLLVTTRRATQPRRLAPPPSLFLVNYLSKVFLDLFPPPSDELRQDRTVIRVVISDAASGPPLFVSSHLWPSTATVPPPTGRGPTGSRFYHRRVFPRVVRS